MLRNVYTSPQLTVEAKIALFLMVSHIMICGVVPISRSVTITSDNSRLLIQVFPNNNSVMAVARSDSIYANLTIHTNEKLQNEIYSAETNRSICLNDKLRLVTMKRHKNPKKNCLFLHKMREDGYDQYISVKYRCFIAFEENGKPLVMTKWIVNRKHKNRHGKMCSQPKNLKASFLLKQDEKTKNVDSHNRKFDQKQRAK